MSINEARRKIDDIDKKMIKLFEARMQAVNDVVKYKKEHNLAIFDEKREKEIIKNNLKLVDISLKDYYLEFFEKMLEISKKYQEANYE